MVFLEIEELLCKIDGIKNVKIIGEDQITELHVLASRTRSPKQIVRDIESAIFAVFDFKIDRKVISIAQIQTKNPKEVRPIKLDTIAITSSDTFIQSDITLIQEDVEYTSTSRAIRTTENSKRVVALSTLSAIEQILGQAIALDLHDIIITESRGIRLVTVLIVSFINNKEEVHVGTEIIKDDLNTAIINATLDAAEKTFEFITN